MESSERVEKLKDIFKQCVDKMLKDDYYLIKMVVMKDLFLFE